MKQLLPFGLGCASALAILLLPSMMSPQKFSSQNENPMPGGVSAGTAVFDFNVMQGTAGGFPGLTEHTAVTMREIEENWILIDYPGQRGGPSWVNRNAIISYQINR